MVTPVLKSNGVFVPFFSSKGKGILQRKPRMRVNPNQQWMLPSLFHSGEWPEGSVATDAKTAIAQRRTAGVTIRERESQGPPRAVAEKTIPGGRVNVTREEELAPIWRPAKRRPGRPRKEPLRLDQVEKILGDFREYQGALEVVIYEWEFESSLDLIQDPVYEKDLVQLFVTGLRTELQRLMGMRRDYAEINRLEVAYRCAKEAETEYAKNGPRWTEQWRREYELRRSPEQMGPSE